MRTDILLAMRGLADIYDKTLTNELNQIWLSVLSELSPEEMACAVKAYIMDPSNIFFPRPGQIYGLARPKADVEQEASLIVDRLFLAIRSYGTDAIGVERAKTKIGPVGWQYVTNKGGWEIFSRSITSEDDIPILQSQARKSIMGLIHRKIPDMESLPDGQVEAITLRSLGIEMKQLS